MWVSGSNPLFLLLLTIGVRKCSAQVSGGSVKKPQVISAQTATKPQPLTMDSAEGKTKPNVTKDSAYAVTSLYEIDSPGGEPQNISALPLSPPEECAAYTMKSNSIDIKFPHKCCNFNTKECYFKHNGYCKRRWEAGKCDYTVDICPHHGNNWFCTCCASCDGPQIKSECKSNGGSCRKSCYKDEYMAWWQNCSSKNCRCCKKYCMQKTCANGKGICKHSSEQCPRGYYASKESHCKGFGCKCCVRCNTDLQCWKKKGFCEGWEKKCPFGYKDEKCHCNQKECRCCSRRWIFETEDEKMKAAALGMNVNSDPRGPIRIKQSQQMEVNIPQGGPMPEQEVVMEKAPGGVREGVGEGAENGTEEEQARRGQETMATEVDAMEREEESRSKGSNS